MKKAILIITLLLFSTVAFAQKHSENDLIGKWAFKANPQAGLIFKKGMKVMIYKGAEQPADLTYTADFSKTPIKGQLLLSAGDQTFPLKVELEFVNKNTVKWKVYKSDVPGADQSGVVAQVLTRVKK